MTLLTFDTIAIGLLFLIILVLVLCITEISNALRPEILRIQATADLSMANGNAIKTIADYLKTSKGLLNASGSTVADVDGNHTQG